MPYEDSNLKVGMPLSHLKIAADLAKTYINPKVNLAVTPEGVRVHVCSSNGECSLDTVKVVTWETLAVMASNVIVNHITNGIESMESMGVAIEREE